LVAATSHYAVKKGDYTVEQLEKGKILVVDDEELIRKCLMAFLQLRGYEADCAESGMEALKMIKKDNYAVVISDIRMPQIDGLELLTEIKSFNPYIEVIMITAHSTMEIAMKCMGKGAFGFIQKPMKDINEIMEVVQKSMEYYFFKQKMILKALSQ
jgi:DNA-binding NtrC family response regulator